MASPFAAQILSSRAVIRLAGEAPLAFLHNLLTCETADLPPRTWAYGALLSPQGKIQHDVFVIRDGTSVFIDCALSQRSALLQKLKLYRLRAKIEIEADESSRIAVGSATGLGGDDPRLAGMGQRSIVATGAMPEGTGYAAARIANGLADSDADIGENALFPHEANLDLVHGVSFTKGCYVGQEVVSRMQHRGTARNRILPITGTAALPPKGSEIRSGSTAIGEVLSSVGTEGLALLRLDRLAEVTAPLLTSAVRLSVHKPQWMTLPVTIPDAAA